MTVHAGNFFPPEYRILFGVSRVGNKIRGIIDLEKIVSELVPETKEDEDQENEEIIH